MKPLDPPAMKTPHVLAIIAAALAGQLMSAPVNDNFENATVLTGAAVEAPVDLVGATRQAGEPNPYSYGWNSVWFKWTAPASGTVFIDSLAEAGQGAISVYTGATVTALTQVGSDPYSTYSGVWPYNPYYKVDAVAGITYRIAVWAMTYGNIPSPRISVFQAAMPPANNDFAAATVLPADGATTSTTGYTYAATCESPEPDLPFWLQPGNVRFPTIWYAFTPNFSGFAEFQTSAGICPVEITAYVGTSLTSLTKLSSNGSAGPDGRTTVRWKCNSGTSYRIRIARNINSYSYAEFGRFTVSFGKLNPAAGVRALVVEARARLESRSAGCIQAADTLLQQALASNATDPEANFLRALTRLALAGDNAGFKSLVTTMTGDASPSLDPYDSHVNLTYDLDDDPILPATSNPQELANWLGTSFLPELAAIRAHLNQVPAPFTTNLTGAETGTDHLEIDYADVKALIASTHALEMLVDFITTYNLSVSLRNLILWDKSGNLSAEQTRATYVNLLGFSATDRRAQFRQNFSLLRQSGETALSFARFARSQPLMHLWNTDDILPEDEQALIADLERADFSFDGVIVTIGDERVNLSKFLSTTASLRAWLPGISGDSVLASSLPDPSFGGIFPDMTQSRANTLLAGICQVIDLGTFGAYAANFLSGLPMADRSQTADPDHDGRNNFHEYAFGGDPTKPDLARQVVAIVQTAGADITDFRVKFSRRRNLTDVNYLVAVSDDMQAWDRSEAKVTPVGTPVANEDGLTETVEYSIHGLGSGKPPRFVRLEASLITIR